MIGADGRALDPSEQLLCAQLGIDEEGYRAQAARQSQTAANGPDLSDEWLCAQLGIDEKEYYAQVAGASATSANAAVSDGQGGEARIVPMLCSQLGISLAEYVAAR